MPWQDQLRTISQYQLPRTKRSASIQIRVAVADPSSVMRTGLIQTIESEPQMRVIASAGCRQELITALHQARADVLVVDPVGLGKSPISLIRELYFAFTRLKIVVFSSFVEFVPEAFSAGVRAYVDQKEPDDQLLLAIRAVKARQRFISPLVRDYVDSHAWSASQERLSPRELRCLAYLAQGMDNQAICLRMGVELRTVENYVTKIRAKTACETRTQMVAWYQLVYGAPAELGSEPCLIRQRKSDETLVITTY